MKITITEDNGRFFSWKLPDKYEEELIKKIMKIQNKLDKGLI